MPAWAFFGFVIATVCSQIRTCPKFANHVPEATCHHCPFTNPSPPRSPQWSQADSSRLLAPCPEAIETWRPRAEFSLPFCLSWHARHAHKHPGIDSCIGSTTNGSLRSTNPWLQKPCHPHVCFQKQGYPKKLGGGGALLDCWTFRLAQIWGFKKQMFRFWFTILPQETPVQKGTI